MWPGERRSLSGGPRALPRLGRLGTRAGPVAVETPGLSSSADDLSRASAGFLDGSSLLPSLPPFLLFDVRPRRRKRGGRRILEGPGLCSAAAQWVCRVGQETVWTLGISPASSPHWPRCRSLSSPAAWSRDTERPAPLWLSCHLRPAGTQRSLSGFVREKCRCWGRTVRARGFLTPGLARSTSRASQPRPYVSSATLLRHGSRCSEPQRGIQVAGVTSAQVSVAPSDGLRVKPPAGSPSPACGWTCPRWPRTGGSRSFGGQVLEA